MTHICVGKLSIIGSDNGLSPKRHQAIIWNKDGILLIGPLGTNFIEIFIEIQTFSLTEICLKMSSAKCCSFRLGLNVLKSDIYYIINYNFLEISINVFILHIKWLMCIFPNHDDRVTIRHQIANLPSSFNCNMIGWIMFICINTICICFKTLSTCWSFSCIKVHARTFYGRNEKKWYSWIIVHILWQYTLRGYLRGQIIGKTWVVYIKMKTRKLSWQFTNHKSVL